MTDDESLPDPAPDFAAHFTDPLYDDPASDFAPFGNDEGADLLAEWAERREELGADSTVAEVLEEEGPDGTADELNVPVPASGAVPDGLVDAAMRVQGAGFTLLRLTGRIDERGRRDTLKALDVLISLYGSEPELVRQREDLDSWRG
ncbi:hypothetical protein WDZ17_13825 [Pseudokineococcus basanitobsidens]|uniref:Uncharacterized protein n=1 Tax=Pseudokineococcus basanitobsidens TaxID=1926649 RepID=A0ABU8RMQ2_9ACTN